MIYSTYKYYLSYLWDQTICVTKSAYHHHLEVMLSKGRLRLNTKEATYSYEDLYGIFRHSFEGLKFEEQNIDQALLLGFGLGSIPNMLYHQFRQKNIQYTAVEIDEIIIQLAQKYLDPRVLAAINFHCTDAYEFVMNKTNETLYDFIAMDVFIDTNTPSKFQDPAFLAQLQHLLAPNAWLLYNTLIFTPALKQNTQHFYTTIFQKQFPNSQQLTTWGNKMLVYQQGV